jgi:hypothetical protein
MKLTIEIGLWELTVQFFTQYANGIWFGRPVYESGEYFWRGICLTKHGFGREWID